MFDESNYELCQALISISSVYHLPQIKVLTVISKGKSISDREKMSTNPKRKYSTMFRGYELGEIKAEI